MIIDPYCGRLLPISTSCNCFALESVLWICFFPHLFFQYRSIKQLNHLFGSVVTILNAIESAPWMPPWGLSIYLFAPVSLVCLLRPLLWTFVESFWGNVVFIFFQYPDLFFTPFFTPFDNSISSLTSMSCMSWTYSSASFSDLHCSSSWFSVPTFREL